MQNCAAKQSRYILYYLTKGMTCFAFLPRLLHRVHCTFFPGAATHHPVKHGHLSTAVVFRVGWSVVIVAVG